MVGKIFERSSFGQRENSFKHRRLPQSSIYASGRGRRQTNVRVGFLDNFRDKMIAAKDSARRIQKHQVGGSVLRFEWRERLQGQCESRLGKDGASASALELQPQAPVAPNAIRIQTGGSGGSIR